MQKPNTHTHTNKQADLKNQDPLFITTTKTRQHAIKSI
ncbi:unnamed protein product [Brassica napus]|uniref:(rape) hypothetical protein n=1 Tax=Brassica napus TaxID=3708 RepID=A0A816JXC4_BRANA|nr:unnamed protein product [Brassica napus]